MKRIKNFCLEILSMVKNHIAAAIALVIISVIVVLCTSIKSYLTNMYTLTFPLWGWVVLCVAISCPLAVILKIIDLRHKKEVLTDKNDIYNKLYWWLGQQLRFVQEQTEDNKLVTWHFSVIDKRNKLSPGSAKKFLPAFFTTEPKPFPITLICKGEKTIAIRYNLR